MDTLKILKPWTQIQIYKTFLEKQIFYAIFASFFTDIKANSLKINELQ